MKQKIFVIIMVLTLASALGVAMFTPVSAITTSDGFVYSVNPDGNTITVTDYVGDNTQIIIPSEIDGKTVTDIGSYAFSKGEVYDETTTKITIPNTVKTIGEYAFYNLRAITEIVIPDSVTHIYEGAFHKCINVTKLTIGKNLTYIGKNGVSRLHALNEINIASGNTAFKVESGCLIDVLCKTVISSLDISNIKIPAGIQQIGDCAFYERTKLTSIVIPDGVIYIGQNAFDGAPLAKLVLPKSVETIGYAAFANGGNALRSGHVYYEGVYFSEVDIGSANNNLLSCSNIHFDSCMVASNYVHVYGGGQSDNICDYCNKKRLSSYKYVGNSDGSTITITQYLGSDDEIIIPSQINGRTVTAIGDYAFSKGEVYDETTKKITIPNTVKTIGAYAFYNLRAITEVVIPDSVTTVGEGAFHKCINVTKLTIGANVTTIGKNGVSRMHALKEIIIKNGNNKFRVESGCLVDIANYTVITTLDISDIKIPAGIRQIGDCSFYLRKKISKVVIPDGVTYIGENAFDGSSVSFVVIPKTVKTIVNAAFANTDNLTTPSGKVYYEGTADEYSKINWVLSYVGTTQNNNIMLVTRATKYFNCCMVASDNIHAYSAECDTSCNECGKENRTTMTGHVYGNWINVDTNQHWKACACGKKIEVANHVFENNVCKICGYVKGTVHVYDDTWHSDETHHWKECTKCNSAKANESSHVGGTATCQTKKICTVCQRSYGELAGCDYVENTDAKYLKTEATCSSKAIYKKSCSVCGKAHETDTFESGELNGEKHNGGSYESNDNEHWTKCSCGQELERKSHAYGEWTVTKESTKTEKGLKEKTCNTCGFKVSEDIPEIADDGSKTMNTVFLLIAIISFVIAAGCVTALILVKRKSVK